ncbi:MAG: hypothetical protein JXQ87_06590 [Bacteroidia bacterium]
MIRSLLHFNHVINKRFIDVFEEHNISDKRCISLMSHVLNAQLIWNARIDGSEPKWKAWMIHEIVEMKKTNEMGYEWSMKLMANAAPNLIIKYENTEGSEFVNAAQDVMLHIVNHASYHRGQLAARFKELNIQPPVSDFIHFQREL